MTLGESVFPLAKIYCLTRLVLAQMVIKPGEIARLSSLRNLRRLEIDPREQSVLVWNHEVNAPSQDTELSKEDLVTIGSFHQLTTLLLGYSSTSKKKSPSQLLFTHSSSFFCYWIEFDLANIEFLRPLTNLTQIDVPAALSTAETITNLSILTNIQVL